MPSKCNFRWAPPATWLSLVCLAWLGDTTNRCGVHACSMVVALSIVIAAVVVAEALGDGVQKAVIEPALDARPAVRPLAPELFEMEAAFVGNPAGTHSCSARDECVKTQAPAPRHEPVGQLEGSAVDAAKRCLVSKQLVMLGHVRHVRAQELRCFLVERQLAHIRVQHVCHEALCDPVPNKRQAPSVECPLQRLVQQQPVAGIVDESMSSSGLARSAYSC